MRKLTYYVAATLDGFIAAPDGEFGFFTFEGELMEVIRSDYPETLPSAAREPLGIAGTPHQRFDTVIMGRGTYEPALKAGITSPYAHLRQYVLSTTLSRPDPEVEVVATDPVELVRGLKREDGMGIWLCGGGRLAGALLPEIDELVIKRNPLVIGSGIPMIDAPFAPLAFTRTASRPLDGGVTVETFEKR